jgi:hypothetical protein
VTGSCTDLALKVVFVTSTVYSGNLGGLAGADALCMAQAAVGNLPGTFKAWLSTTTVNAESRLTHSAGPYVLQDGTTVVANNWADLTNGDLDHAIDQDENGLVSASGTSRSYISCSGVSGAVVFTDSRPNGTFYDNFDCGAWTIGTAATFAIGGNSYAANSEWSLACNAPCDLTSPLYCIQQ